MLPNKSSLTIYIDSVMQRELIINVNPTEVSIALCEDKVLVELNKEQCETGFAVGDIYVGKVRKIMPGLNAAFVNIGHEKDAFIHYLDLGANYSSLKRVVVFDICKSIESSAGYTLERTR